MKSACLYLIESVEAAVRLNDRDQVVYGKGDYDAMMYDKLSDIDWPTEFTANSTEDSWVFFRNTLID